MAGDLQEFRSYGMAISLLLCYHMVEIGCRKEEAADFMDPKAYSPSTFKVLTYIQNHYDEDLDSEEVARISNFNRTYFCSILKKEVDPPFLII